MTIAITSSGIALDGPLVAGEKVAVTVSGLALAAEDKPTLALLARFPAALLASVELAEDAQTPGTWAGELDTATKQTALFFATARADERRDAALELVSGRASLARLTVPMANSALCPKPDGSPFASPVYIPVPGPPGQGGDPYDQAPQMDGEASAGTADEYARGDHRHPTDDTRQAVIEDLAAIRSGAAAGATAVQPSALSAYRTASAQDAIDGAQNTAIAEKYTKPPTGIPASDLASGVIPTVPVTSVNGETGDVALYGNTLIMGQGQSTLVSTAITNAQSDATRALNELPFKATAAAIAPAFSSSSTYAVGDYCTYEGLLYKCTTAVSTAGAWNAANWSAVAVTDEMPAPITVDSAMSSSSTNPVQNKVVNAAIDGKISWDNSDKNSATIGNRQAYINHGIYSLVVGDNAVATGHQCVAIGFGVGTTGNNSVVIGWWSSAGGNSALSVGQNTNAVARGSIAAGKRATASTGDWGTGTAHQYAFVWQGGGSVAPSDNPSVGGGYYHSHDEGTFNINPKPASGSTDPATGFWIGETKLSDYIRYAFASPTPSVSGTAATVACEDRAINDFTVATGITSLTITPPAAVTGRARDFFCRVSLTDSSLPTVTLSGGTIDIGSTEVAGMTQGVNLLMFTEIASGHWLASRRSAS